MIDQTAKSEPRVVNTDYGQRKFVQSAVIQEQKPRPASGGWKYVRRTVAGMSATLLPIMLAHNSDAAEYHTFVEKIIKLAL
ncbi:hypothetical protein COU74_00350 [Candidatus Peregrinibacteria bacterium CG10_big_fil_rev_8_21_14_0_10_36_19]|nr:MAG: hypothetical protein COU74_00350 [Candidatus Peregrinibacteria bacterium CG10_big_fil_rev_8_21_14_0_10_36_19]